MPTLSLTGALVSVQVCLTECLPSLPLLDATVCWASPRKPRPILPANGSLLILISVCFRFPHSSAAPAKFTCAEPQRREWRNTSHTPWAVSHESVCFVASTQHSGSWFWSRIGWIWVITLLGFLICKMGMALLMLPASEWVGGLNREC